MPKLRILCLPGWRTSGEIMKMQLKLASFLQGGSVELDFCPIDHTFPATGPPDESIQRFFPDEKYYEWWDMDKDTKRYTGVEQTLERVAGYLNTEKYDGIMGFSQGAALTSLLSILCTKEGADERFHQKFRFSIMVAGFVPRDADIKKWYQEDNSISIPSIHIWGSADSMALASATLARKFDQSAVQLHIHEGNHVIPNIPKESEAFAKIHHFLERQCL